MNAQSSAPGWYPSPENPALVKYWDGSAWSGESHPAVPAPGLYPPVQSAPYVPFQAVANVGTNGFAIASMVLGILWIYWAGSVLALIFGYTALKQLRERPQNGKGMAIAGIVLGWVGVAVLVLVIIAVIAGTNRGGAGA